jgi:hypothetical protein
MRVKVKIRWLAGAVFAIGALATPAFMGFLSYFEREFVLKSKEAVESAKLSGSFEEMEETARALYLALIAMRDGMELLLSDLRWVFALVAVLGLGIFWSARRIPN